MSISTTGQNSEKNTTRSPSSKLYTSEMLALATGLAAYPRLPDAALHGSARSDTCGGSLAIDVQMADGTIASVGLMVQACAVGQASAALFADWVIGKSAADTACAHTSVVDWLAGNAPLPSAPDLSAIAIARDYPARHGAILLPWKALENALPDARI